MSDSKQQPTSVELERRLRRVAYRDLVEGTTTRPMPVVDVEHLRELTREPHRRR